jgi:hypothetical protein
VGVAEALNGDHVLIHCCTHAPADSSMNMRSPRHFWKYTSPAISAFSNGSLPVGAHPEDAARHMDHIVQRGVCRMFPVSVVYLTIDAVTSRKDNRPELLDRNVWR